MNNSIEFKSAKELYERVTPALYSKVKELRGLGYKHISEKDVWNYLVNNDWKERKDLLLSDLISDILYCDNNKLNDYIAEKIKDNKFEDEEIL
ncbi:MAG: hypothetical protein IJK67_06290 [Bacilli bacterium]|nr:hypothetical protein [Bacilli bacterium]